MHCAADACQSGKLPCTRAECGYADVLDEYDRQSLAHWSAMHARTDQPSYLPREQARPKPRSQLGLIDWAAVVVVSLFFIYALLHTTGVI